MTTRNLIKIITVLSIISILAFGQNAFAGWGMGHGWGHGRGMGYGRGWNDDSDMGYGSGMGWGRGMGRGRGMGYGRGMGRGFGGFGYNPDLKEEDLRKLDEQRTAFFESTKNIRNDIFEKNIELRSELAKQTPDAQKAEQLQKEISELEAQFDKSRIDHMINMKKINPNVGRGFGGRGPRGFGGPCWR